MFDIGAKGTYLFFVMSGYLAFISLEDGKILNYYKRRALRILPTYYVCLALLYIIDLMMYIAVNDTINGVFSGQCGILFLRYVFFVHGVIPSNNYWMWNNHNALWTMSSFIFFYLIAPIIKKIIKTFYRALILLVTLLFLTPYMIQLAEKWLASYPEDAHINWFVSQHPLAVLYCFMFGVVLYFAILENKLNLYLGVLLGVLIVTNPSWYSWEILFTILIAVAVYMPEVFKNERIKYIMRFFSEGSFALYLLHPMILSIIQIIYGKMGGKCEGLVFAILLYIMSVLLSYMAHICIIKPVEKLIYSKKCRLR